MTQLALSLEDQREAAGHARRSDPDTSRIAARAAGRSGLIRLVEDCLRANRGGLTDWEILAELGLPDRKRGSVVKRRGDLGAVAVPGVTRLSPDGLPCTVWRLP